MRQKKQKRGQIACPLPCSSSVADLSAPEVFDFPKKLLLRDDQILDLGVGRRGQDLLGHQLVLPFVRSSLNDLVGILVANAR